MTFTARSVLPLAVMCLVAGCRHTVPVRPAPPPVEMLAPSPRLIVGRVIAVEPADGFAYVELATDAPANALTDGSELIARTPDLRETARLRASRYIRGRTLGTKIVGGQPSPGDEVVWLAP